MKRHTRHHIRLFIWVPIIGIAIGVVALALRSAANAEDRLEPPSFGMTFSTKYATELGLDPRQVYLAILDELDIGLIRLPVYWDEIEPQQGSIQLAEIEWYLDAAAARNVQVTPVVGLRVPRWPECHPPAWTRNLPEAEMQAAELEMVDAVVTEFRQHPAVHAWQVQNEPLFPFFGECPWPDRARLQESITLVRGLDPAHPIVLTESGELSSWTRLAPLADTLGISLYRTTWNSFWGYFHYPLPTEYYRLKAWLVRPLVDEIIITELQVEPWVPSTILTTPLSEQFRSMNPQRLRNNLDFASRTGFSEVYLWGGEWWYWLKTTQGYPEMWEAGRQALQRETQQ